MREYYNTELGKVVSLAKDMGLKVWTFDSSGKIRQVFFDDGKTFGSASVDFSLLTYSTCHRANGACGTGFRLHEGVKEAREEYILETFCNCPGWAYNQYHKYVIKESFAEHIKRDKILTWYEL